MIEQLIAELPPDDRNESGMSFRLEIDGLRIYFTTKDKALDKRTAPGGDSEPVIGG
ncbi:hypothetical protein [Methylocaldum gracile]|uniref:hypothetical protein n=1 Tax=Methylocaldum sp. 0917 TaxID=2485163 RepID=UPI00141501ED